ncbi:hypothetical protein [Acidovorax kalamii]|uniref:hypothetical protein n=1 Tax=Acidovorax kalamii TaxID=2004485 RepID=UPI001054B574|nr:hypothetical protein [Acidovorax kalamii]
MLELGSTEFHLAIPSFPEAELKHLSSKLFDTWEEYVDTALALRDYSLLLQVEEGSVGGIAKIGAALGILYIGIGNYGDFVSGVKTIGEQIGATSEFVTQHASRVFSCPDSKVTTRRRGGTIKSLQHLFTKVQRGELSAEEATARAEKILGTEAASTPQFLEDLRNAFDRCPRHHEQQQLPFVDEPDAPRFQPLELPSKPKSPRPAPVLGPALQLRIEVWRESKRKRKHTRVMKL